MKQTFEEVTAILLNAKEKRRKALDDVEAMITRWAQGSKARASDAMELIHALQNAEFTWGVYDATRSIMSANKATEIEDGRLIH
jgi:vacuolar-type H+-ATPase subunit D/Vma8